MPAATRDLALLFFAALLFHLAGTWALPLIDPDEPRFAEASREMIERHDYIVPFFNNRYRFDKPPLTYWFQIASYRVFGESDFAARFPTAVAAALTSAVIFCWGKRLGFAREGLWAAMFFALCLQMFQHGKAAVADMWLVLSMTLAHWGGYELLRDRFGGTWRSATLRPNELRRWWWLFYLSLGMAFLAKGPIGWTPLGAVVIYQYLRPVPHFGRRFKFVRGIIFMLALVALWGVPALVQTHGEFLAVGLGRHVVGRSLGTMQGHGGKSILLAIGSLPFYFVTIFLSFAPWSWKLPWLTRRLWRKRDALDLYLLVSGGIVFVIFSLVKTKLPHYTLPAHPLLALLLARHWLADGGAMRVLRNWSLGMAALCLTTALFVFPFLARMVPARELFRQSEAYLQPQMDFGSYDFDAPSLVWYFRARVHGWLFFNRDNERDVATMQPDQIVPFLAAPGAHFVVMPTALASKLYPTLPNGYRKFLTRGFDIAKGHWVNLTLVMKNT